MRRSSRSTEPEQRAYGSDRYWAERYIKPTEDATDEWLLGWAQLQPLLSSSIAANAAVLDLGCGTSSLGFDLLAEQLTAEGRVLAIDNAPAAIARLEQERARAKRDRRGTNPSSLRITPPPESRAKRHAAHGEKSPEI